MLKWPKDEYDSENGSDTEVDWDDEPPKTFSSSSAKPPAIPPESSDTSEKIIKDLQKKLFAAEQELGFCSKTIDGLKRTTSVLRLSVLSAFQRAEVKEIEVNRERLEYAKQIQKLGYKNDSLNHDLNGCKNRNLILKRELTTSRNNENRLLNEKKEGDRILAQAQVELTHARASALQSRDIRSVAMRLIPQLRAEVAISKTSLKRTVETLAVGKDCDICFETMNNSSKKPLMTCANGHYCCETCRPQLPQNRCHACREDLLF